MTKKNWVTQKRHITKTITWRILASIDTLLISWLLTGSWKIGTSIAFVEVITKMILYYLHERVWYNYRPNRNINIKKNKQ